MEKLLFVKDVYHLTQGYGSNSFSHQERLALDVSARGGNKKIYAPFSGYVAKKFVKKDAAYSVWIVSNEKVLCKDGNAYYVVMLLTHPSEIANMNVNDTFKQGDYILNDGDTGFSTGKHLDFEIAVYKNKEDINISWYGVKNGSRLTGSVDPTEFMVLKTGTKINNETYNGKIYHFSYEDEIIKKEDKSTKYEIGRYVTLYNMRVRKGPGLEYEQKKVKELSMDGKRNATSKNPNAKALYKKGTVFDALKIYEHSKTNIWAKTYSGYVNIVIDNDVNCKRL